MDLQRKLLGIGDTLAHCSRIKMIFENEYGKEWMLPIISRPFPSLSTDTFARFSYCTFYVKYFASLFYSHLRELFSTIFDRFNLISDKSNRFSEREREREGILLDRKRRSVNYRSKEEKLDAILGTITLPPSPFSVVDLTRPRARPQKPFN